MEKRAITKPSELPTPPPFSWTEFLRELDGVVSPDEHSTAKTIAELCRLRNPPCSQGTMRTTMNRAVTDGKVKRVIKRIQRGDGHWQSAPAYEPIDGETEK
jgi:hypothetical protein